MIIQRIQNNYYSVQGNHIGQGKSAIDAISNNPVFDILLDRIVWAYLNHTIKFWNELASKNYLPSRKYYEEI